MRVALLLLFIAVAANAAEWTMDGAHSETKFKIRHLMISNVTGAFKDFTAKLTTDDKDKPTLLEGTIQTKSIDTANAKRDEHLKSPDFFDTEKFPTITFKSKKFSGTKNVKVTGELTMHGVTKEVTLNGELTPAIKDPMGNPKRGFSGTTKINRKDFGLTWNKAMDGGGVVLGETVDVDVSFEFAGVKKDPQG